MSIVLRHREERSDAVIHRGRGPADVIPAGAQRRAGIHVFLAPSMEDVDARMRGHDGSGSAGGLRGRPSHIIPGRGADPGTGRRAYAERLRDFLDPDSPLRCGRDDTSFCVMGGLVPADQVHSS